MRLLIDCMPLRAGGGIQVATAFLEGLSQHQTCEWHAVLPASMKRMLAEAEQLAASGHVRFLPKDGALDIQAARSQLKRIEREWRPDVVFTVFGPAYWKPRAPHIVGFALPHLLYSIDDYVPEPKTLLFRASDWLRCRSLRRADWIVVETETVRQRLAARINYPAGKISVIGNCVNPRLLAHKATAVQEGKRYVILVPSAYYLHKNLEIVPRAAAALRELAPDFDFEFRLTLDPESKAAKHLAKLADDSKASHHVKFVGELPLQELASQYQEAHVVFLPTLREASTAVYPEAFYFGRPLITSDLDFARELCGPAAVFSPPTDASTIASSLIALAKDRPRQSALIEAGRRRLAEYYPSSQMKFQQQCDVIRNIARGTPQVIGPALGHNQEKSPVSMPAGAAFHDRIADQWGAGYAAGSFKKRLGFFQGPLDRAVTKGQTWLDLGCGSGVLSVELARRGAKVVACDGSPKMLEQAKQTMAQMQSADADFQISDATDLSWVSDGKFDGILCSSVIEYVDDPDKMLSEIARTLAANGTLILSLPPKHSALRTLQRGVNAIYKVTGRTRFQYLDASKFEVERKSIGAWFARAGLHLETVLPFDPVLPSASLGLLQPALLICVAKKCAQAR